MKYASLAPKQPLSLFADNPTPRLYDRLVEVVRVRHYSRRTEEAYIHRGKITVGQGKRHQDRVTTTPRAVVHPLQKRFRHVQTLHQHDLADGYGRGEFAELRRTRRCSRACESCWK